MKMLEYSEEKQNQTNRNDFFKKWGEKRLYLGTNKTQK
jgi:hypothetical protein